METLTGVLVAVASVGVIVFVIFALRMMHQVARAGAELESLLKALQETTLPRVSQVLEQAEAELAEIRVATRSAQRIVDQVQTTVDQVQRTVDPALEAAEEASTVFHQVTAMLRGVKTGVASFRSSMSRRAAGTGEAHY